MVNEPLPSDTLSLAKEESFAFSSDTVAFARPLPLADFTFPDTVCDCAVCSNANEKAKQQIVLNMIILVCFGMVL